MIRCDYHQMENEEGMNVFSPATCSVFHGRESVPVSPDPPPQRALSLVAKI